MKLHKEILTKRDKIDETPPTAHIAMGQTYFEVVLRKKLDLKISFVFILLLCC